MIEVSGGRAAAQRPRRGLSSTAAIELWGLAAAGTFLAHSLTYWVVFRNGPTRAAFLAETGHSYGRAAMAAAVAGGIWFTGSTLIRIALLGLRGAPLRPSTSRILRPLVVLQLAAFTLMEVGERVIAGAPLESAHTGRVLAVGLAVQVAVALVFALVLRVMGRTAHRLGRALARRGRSRAAAPARRWTPVTDAARPIMWWAGIGAGRAPPVS